VTRGVLELDRVSKVYGRPPTEVVAVRDVDLVANEGEIVVVLGPSGSGKTTLLNIAGCLLRPTAGDVVIMGRRISDLTEKELSDVRLRHVGFVFQSFNLLAPLTAEENVLIPMNMAGQHRATARRYARHLLDELGLLNLASRVPSQLSAGEQQRVAIARALANSPELLLADEPTANLDSKTGQRVMQILSAAIQRKEAKALVVVTHDARVLDFASRTLWMEDGRLREREAGSSEAAMRP
jgi:putative ABC transport system ATP-binding protein